MLKEQSILVAPGIPFGENGRHYVRISLALDDQLLTEAAKRLAYLIYITSNKKSQIERMKFYD